MRMEELSDSRYIKGTDTVERYLLGLVQAYFKNGTVAFNTSREFIIKQALKRMKEELDFEDIGVLSITLPDGRVLTGPVTITIDDIGGEPKIIDKKTAFNVDFGDQQNTACEGNDPRLSDARQPLPHKHDIDDIIGLSGTVSTLSGMLSRVNAFAHKHDNKNILDMLIYTGTKTKIDLGSVEKAEERVKKLSDDIKKLIKSYQDDIPATAQSIHTLAEDTSKKVDEVKASISANNSTCLQQAKKYAEDEFTKITSTFNASSGGGGYVVKDKLDDVLKNATCFIGSMDISLNSLSPNTSISKVIDGNISTSLMNKGQDLEDCHFEFHFKHKDSNGNYVLSPMPYMVIDNSELVGQIIASYFSDINNHNQVIVTFERFVSSTSISLNDTFIVVDVYARQEVTV